MQLPEKKLVGFVFFLVSFWNDKYPTQKGSIDMKTKEQRKFERVCVCHNEI